jgi:hypothetical protein
MLEKSGSCSYRKMQLLATEIQEAHSTAKERQVFTLQGAKRSHRESSSRAKEMGRGHFGRDRGKCVDSKGDGLAVAEQRTALISQSPPSPPTGLCCCTQLGQRLASCGVAGSLAQLLLPSHLVAVLALPSPRFASQHGRAVTRRTKCADDVRERCCDSASSDAGYALRCRQNGTRRCDHVSGCHHHLHRP